MTSTGPSQHGQDEWVLSLYDRGTFLDVGCGDAYFLSNTFALERLGWSGIAVDPFPRNFERRPKTRVVQAVVYSEKGKTVEFMRPDEAELAGIREHIANVHHPSVFAASTRVQRMQTQLLHEILDELQAPRFIEYFSLDIEGAEHAVLSTFPLDHYRFGCMSIEHNHQEPQRTWVRELLGAHGYRLARSVKCDDWYVTEGK